MPCALVWLPRLQRKKGEPAFEAQIWDGPPYAGGIAEGRRREPAAEHKFADLTADEASKEFEALKRRYPAPPEPVEA